MRKEFELKMSDDLIGEVQKRFLKRHWKMTLVFAAVFAAAVSGAILVFLWFVGFAQTTALVPTLIGQWSIGIFITFILHTIFWELVLVVSWVLVLVGIIIVKWYKQLPDEEREGWPKRGKREESDAFGMFFGIVWLIVVWLDNRWNLAFEDWTLNNWIYSGLAAVGWVFVIFGIPMSLYFIWWINKERKEEPKQLAETVDEVVDEA